MVFEPKTYEKADEMLRLIAGFASPGAHTHFRFCGYQAEKRAERKFFLVRPYRILAATIAISAIIAFLGNELHAAENLGAIGQIVPAGGVISLTGTPGGFVDEVRVAPGDNVQAGAILMTLRSDALTAEHDLAMAEIETARVLSGAQIAAQNYAVEIAGQSLQDASRRLASYRAVGPQSTSANELSRLEGAEIQARLALQVEQAKVRTANADGSRIVGAAEMRLAIAQAAMEIRAPIDGTILQVDRRTGQLLNGEPAVHMGDLTTMYVVSQVYEGDLLGLRRGMSATIQNATLSEPLSGTVEDISRLIDTRARLGEVWIRLDRAEPANRLIGLEVDVVIAR